MSTTTINSDGSISIALTAQDLQVSLMLLAANGPTALSDIDALFHSRAVQLMNAKYLSLTSAQQTALLTMLAGA